MGSPFTVQGDSCPFPGGIAIARLSQLRHPVRIFNDFTPVPCILIDADQSLTKLCRDKRICRSPTRQRLLMSRVVSPLDEGQKFMLDTIKLIALGSIAVLAAIAANYARPDDPAYLVNALIVMLVAGVMFVRVLRQMGNEQPSLEPHPETEYMDGVVRAGVIATAFWGAVGF